MPSDSNATIMEMDGCVDDLGTVFRNAIERSVPRKQVRDNALGNLPSRIVGFIRERKRMVRGLRGSGDLGR